jgi:hypothetical protein
MLNAYGFSPLYPKYMTAQGWGVTNRSGGQGPDMGNPRAMAVWTNLGKAAAAVDAVVRRNLQAR